MFPSFQNDQNALKPNYQNAPKNSKTTKITSPKPMNYQRSPETSRRRRKKKKKKRTKNAPEIS